MDTIPARVKKQDIFNFFNKYFGDFYDVGIDSHAGGIMFTNKDGSASLSERFTSRRQAYAFMLGMLTGLRLMHQRF